ncbi:Mu-like prophage major head subunit gpT [Stieleria maiorica]|uniref:Mu-like prophage major head subunit gpT n=1 Tax=Stieleria maiorica TaxID=2795974 RepID=A0A5B9MF43_9BACT|nr:Mu-like prophage major head subunit gpT family protein [Stieleria maiorica]QEF98155.1 Mu-like prophage major head subunit gpT [Stieleria maiorica]
MSTGVASYKAIARDVTVKVKDGIKSATPFYPQLATIVPSTGASEKYSWLGSMPGMREWLGPRQFKQIEGADYELKNKKWESSLELLKDDIDDDQIGMLGNLGMQLGTEAAYHPDELMIDVMTAGESSLCFDGQYFFDTDHVWGDSGTQSNDLAKTVVDRDDITPAEFRTLWHEALVAMLGFKRDNGKPYMRPRIKQLDGLIIAVPLSMYIVAEKALNQPIVVEGGAGVSNFVVNKPMLLPLATMPDYKFDLYHTADPIKPFTFQARKPLKVQTKGMDDIEFKEMKVMTEARYNLGYLAWFKAVRTTISTA